MFEVCGEVGDLDHYEDDRKRLSVKHNIFMLGFIVRIVYMLMLSIFHFSVDSTKFSVEFTNRLLHFIRTTFTWLAALGRERIFNHIKYNRHKPRVSGGECYFLFFCCYCSFFPLCAFFTLFPLYLEKLASCSSGSSLYPFYWMMQPKKLHLTSANRRDHQTKLTQ